ncbi:MAG: enoyl-CoA hydratase/isomerase family protein [Actinomycetota bacterium]|nr:enoyl-CoA hydratase/isomerase family protein [Actinomycetota bacterium]
MSGLAFNINDALRVTIGDDFVAVVELTKPPNNFLSMDLIGGVAGALEHLDTDERCRSIVLCAEGKHFCAGADFSTGDMHFTTENLYAAAVRIFRTTKPIVAAIQGAAIGGGLGLALSADFRIASPEARFSANFARLGFHQGFGLSVTLPRLVGTQAAAELLYTGRRIGGEEAVSLGMADRLSSLDDLRSSAHSLAREIAISAPLAIQSIRMTLRGTLADEVAAATDHEGREQAWLRDTSDFKEGTAAMAERREPRFTGK